MQQLEEKAHRLAKQYDESMAVIEIDDGDQYVKRVVRESYCDLPEFVAFDGRILMIVEPDGYTC